MTKSVDPENKKLFESVFGSGENSKIDYETQGGKVLKNQKGTFILSVIDRFFSFLEFIFAKLLPSCHIFSIVYSNIVEGKYGLNSLRSAFDTIIKISIPTCIYTVLVALLIWFVLEAVKYFITFLVLVAYTIEIEVRRRKAIKMTSKISEHLEKKDIEEKVDKLTREGYSEDEVIAHMKELLKQRGKGNGKTNDQNTSKQS